MTAPKALGYPSIFDICTATGRPWAYLDAAKTRTSGELIGQLDNVPADVGLIFVYLHQIDRRLICSALTPRSSGVASGPPTSLPGGS